MSQKKENGIQVIEENVRPYINHVYIEYLLLPDRELKVLLGLKSFAWNGKTDCFPGIDTLAKKVGKGRSQVTEILTILQWKGLIRIEENIGYKSVYYITNKNITSEMLSAKNLPGDFPVRRSNPVNPTGNPVDPQPEIRLTPQPEIRLLSNKNKNNKKEIKNICSSGDELVHEFTSFDKFWSLYPRKQNKKNAMQIWNNKNIQCCELLIIEDLKYRLEHEWKNTPSNYIPMPASYLNGRRWEDEKIMQSGKGKAEDSFSQATRVFGLHQEGIMT